MVNDTIAVVEDSVKIAKENNLKSAEIDYKIVLEFLEVIIWPVVAILAVLILRRPIINLINRMNKIGFAGVSAEASQQKEKIDNGLADQELKSSGKNETVDRVLGTFSTETIEKAVNVIKTESKIIDSMESTQKVEALYRYSQALYLTLAFERIYNIIFGSQLFILDRVNTYSNETKESLKYYYDSAVTKFPEFYSTYKYDDYFDFLIWTELLIKNQDETYSITWYGRDFLKFLVDMGKPLGKNY